MNQLISTGGDPWHWSPQVLVAELYNPEEPWFPMDVELPAQHDLLHSFMGLRITGRVFLTWGDIRHNTYPELFANLDIAFLDHRLWLLDALELLQNRSNGYSSWKATRNMRLKSRPSLSTRPSMPPQSPRESFVSLMPRTQHVQSPTQYHSPPLGPGGPPSTYAPSQFSIAPTQSVHVLGNMAAQSPQVPQLPQPQPQGHTHSRQPSTPNVESLYLLPTDTPSRDPTPEPTFQKTNAHSFHVEPVPMPVRRAAKKRVAPVIVSTRKEAPLSKPRLCRPFLTGGTFSLRNRYPDSDDSSDSIDGGFSMVNTRPHARIQPRKAYKAVLSVFNGHAPLKSLPDADSASSEEGFVVDGDMELDLGDDADDEVHSDDEAQNLPILDIQNTETGHNTVLSDEEVDQIIDERIAQFVDIFKSNYLPRMKVKAFDLWNSGRAERRIGNRLRDAAATVTHVEERIKSIRNQMHLTKWPSRQSLWHQTMCLELSVIEREKKTWLIDLIKGPRPSKAPATTKARIKRRKIEYTPSNSEGEDISDSRSLGSFILDDSDEPMDLPDFHLETADLQPQPTEETPASKPQDAEMPPETAEAAENAHDLPIEHTEIPIETGNGNAGPETESSKNEKMFCTQSEDSPSVPSHSPPPVEAPVVVEEDDQVGEMPMDLDEPTSAPEPAAKEPEAEDKPREASVSPAVHIKEPDDSPPHLPAHAASPSVIWISDEEEEVARPVTYDLSSWKDIPVWFKRTLPKEILETHGDMGRALVGAIHGMSAGLRQKLFATIAECKGDFNNIWKFVIIETSPEPAVPVAAIGLLKCAIQGKFEKIGIDKFQREKLSIIGSLRQYHNSVESFFRALDDIQAGFPLTPDDLAASGEESQEEDLVTDQGNEPAKAKNKRCYIPRARTSIYKERMLREQARWDEKIELAKRSKLQAQIIPSSKSRLIINMSKKEHEPFIYIPDSVANATSEIYDPQIEGIRFIWDNVVANDGKVSSNGCMLAHTMGLGKTMQVISVLLAIVEATHSNDEAIVAQIPAQYRRNRFLILCPAPLADNWVNEIERWCGNSMMPQVFDVSRMKPEQRLAVVRKWSTKSGCLIISFPLFAHLKKMGDDVATLIIDHADIAIADEAHTINQKKTNTRVACDAIRTKARIALTGSPMTNNTLEYYHMVDWVAQKYLGTEDDFKISYANPIEEANVVDATPNEKYRARQLLKRLTKKLRHKVHRATLDSLPANVLPRKQEYIIGFPPLEGLQKRLYSEYVRLHGERPRHLEFGALDNLSLILTHPRCLHLKLIGPKRYRKSGGREPEIVERDKLPREMLNTLMDILNSEPNLDDINLSWRTRHIFTILDECRKIKEKVIIFSQYLDVLDFFQSLFIRQNRKFCRIDGSTSNRVEMVDRFNREDFEVFLVSTRAGGTGLNIQGASRVILVDFKYNPMWEAQAIGRAYRINQTRDVFVYRFVGCGSSEATMFQRAIFKMQLTDSVVDDKTPVVRSQLRKGSHVVHLTPPVYLPYDQFLGVDSVLDKLITEPSNRSGVVYVDHTDTFAEPDKEISVCADIAKYVSDELRAIDERESKGMHAVPHALPHLKNSSSGLAARSTIGFSQASKPDLLAASHGHKEVAGGPATQDKQAPVPYHELPRLVRLQMLANESSSMPAYSTQLPLTLDGSPGTEFPEHKSFRENLVRCFGKVALTSDGIIGSNISTDQTITRAMIIDDYLFMNIKGDLPRNMRENLLLELMQQDRFALAVLEQTHGLDNNTIALALDKVLREKAHELASMDTEAFRRPFPAVQVHEPSLPHPTAAPTSPSSQASSTHSIAPTASMAPIATNPLPLAARITMPLAARITMPPGHPAASPSASSPTLKSSPKQPQAANYPASSSQSAPASGAPAHPPTPGGYRDKPHVPNRPTPTRRDPNHLAQMQGRIMANNNAATDQRSPTFGGNIRGHAEKDFAVLAEVHRRRNRNSLNAPRGHSARPPPGHVRRFSSSNQGQPPNNGKDRPSHRGGYGRY
ncbi:hypothetical protein BROUX41_003815 [Berkeleyomyces rouxiae]